MPATRRLSEAGLAALPAVLVVWLSFHAGGFFPDATGLVAVALAVVLVLRLTLSSAPLAGLSRLGVAAIALVGLFALWTLVSAWWSNAPARAMIEFDRALLYLLVLTLYATLPRTVARVTWIVRLLALGIATVAVVALITRILPEVWPTAPNVVNERLSFPLTYWNALGILTAMGAVLCLHLTSFAKEHPVVRVLAAALVPALACTLFFTFSRGAIVVAVCAALLYVVVARPRALVSGLLATGPTTFIAVKSAYAADLLAKENPTTRGAVEQGQDVALVLVLCMLAAALIRAVLLAADSRIASLRVPGRNPRAVIAAVTALGLVLLIGGAVAAGAPDKVERQYDRFVHGSQIKDDGDLRKRLTNPGNNGRLDHWEVALEGYREDSLKGTGAGTYAELWARHRPEQFTVSDGHSLYLEVLGELGLVGLGLLGASILALLWGLFRQNRGAQGATYGALFAMGVAWAVHAGVDWDWEMPALTLPLFAVGGMALAKKAGETPLVGELGQTTRAIAGIGVLILVVSPWLVASSQNGLVEAARAFKANDCPRAIDQSLSAIDAAGVRPEPYAILAYCDVRGGNPKLGVQMMQNAVDRDPGNWEYHYGLALVKASAGQDPRAAIRRAKRLNPLEEMVVDAEGAFEKAKSPRAWQRAALKQRLPIR